MYRILIGDVLTRLAELPEGSVQTVITSPPYWGLRDYGTATWEGGDESCEHTISMPVKWNDPKRGTAVLRPEVAARGKSADVCHACGATRQDSQLGLEATPEEYVENMVAVFREVWRVLADDGTLWLNIGDSYVGYKGDNYLKDKTRSNLQSKTTVPSSHMVGTPQTSGLKSKDLVGIPWRLAFALQADGWYLRQDIIWHKPNPMPESVKDRTTKAHEYVFLLTKQARYYFDNDAIAEEAKYQPGGTHSDVPQGGFNDKGPIPGTGQRSFRAIRTTRNKRSVWSIATKPFKGAHFAVMPEALVEPCILAGSRPGDTVLDPFTGSGTVAVVALRHDRQFVGVELNPAYAEIAETRIAASLPKQYPLPDLLP